MRHRAYQCCRVPGADHKCCRVPGADHNQQGHAYQRLVVRAGHFRHRNGEQMGRDRGEGIFRIRQPIAESGAPDVDILDFPLGLDVAHKSGQQGGERTGKGGRIT